MTALKQKDFVELDYTGKLKDSGEVFDTTLETEAKKANVYNKDWNYKPVIICIGEGHLIKGIDDFLVGKESEKEYDIDIPSEDAFGKKDTKLLKLVPLNLFKKQNIQPFVGLQVNIDNMTGVIRSVTGGRVIVDFNHPLAGHDISYHLSIKRIVTEKKEKLEALMLVMLNKKPKEIIIEENKIVITTEPRLADEFQKVLKEKITELIGITDVDFK